MAIIKEVIYEINFWSPPLKKHRYSMDSVARRVGGARHGATGILMQEIERRDRIARESGLLKQSDLLVSSAPLQSGSELEVSASAPVEILSGNPYEGTIDPVLSAAAPPKRKFRTLQKIETILYDDSLVKLGELEDEAYQELNTDGYYDELLPIDAGTDYEDEDNSQMKIVIALLGVLVILVGALMLYIKAIF